MLLSLGQPASGQTTDSDDDVEEIVVTGRAQEFYRVDSSSTGTKTPTDYLSIPQSVQVLSRQLMEDQAATRITDLYRSVSGVTEFSYAGVTLRGFRQESEVKYDGVSGDPFAGFSVPQLFNIERVEVLKGPSSMLYGVAEPGGLINYVTKKPTDVTEATVSVFGGNYNHFGVSGEYSGPINDAESMRIRLGGYHQGKEPWRNNTRESNTILDGSLEFDLGTRSTLLLQGVYMDQLLNGHRIRGVPVDDQGNFLTDTSWNAAEPTDFQSLEATVFQAIGDHEYGNGATTSVTLRMLSNERLQEYHEPRGLVDTNADGVEDAMTRQFRDQLRENDEISLTVDNVIPMNFGNLEHLILIGGDYFDIDSDRDVRQTPNMPPEEALSLIDPEYGQVDFVSINAALDASAENGGSLWFFDERRVGLYLQDQITLNDHFEVVAGLRYDSFDGRDELRGTVRGDFDDSSLTFRGGLIYRPVENISTYASYSEGFTPQFVGNQDTTSGPFDPLEGQSYEMGVKGDLFGGAVQASTVVYQITKKNILQNNPDPNAPPDALVSLGEVKSEGLEIDLVGDLTDRWVLMFNYAYNDTIIEDGIQGEGFSGAGFPNLTGERFVNAPENTVGLWTRFEFPGIDSSIAGGMDYVSERINFARQPVPAYEVFDLSWQTNWKNLNFQLNVKNLFDEEYAISGFSRGNFPGEPRTVIFKITADLADL